METKSNQLILLHLGNPLQAFYSFKTKSKLEQNMNKQSDSKALIKCHRNIIIHIKRKY